MKWEDNSVLLYNSKFLGEHNAFVRDCKSIKKIIMGLNLLFIYWSIKKYI